MADRLQPLPNSTLGKLKSDDDLGKQAEEPKAFKGAGAIAVNVKMTKAGTRMVLVLSVGTGGKCAWSAWFHVPIEWSFRTFLVDLSESDFLDLSQTSACAVNRRWFKSAFEKHISLLHHPQSLEAATLSLITNFRSLGCPWASILLVG
jgi:hypothetical protein